jgi:hypothetical protein
MPRTRSVAGTCCAWAIPLCFYPQELQKVMCPTEEVHLDRADIAQAAGRGAGEQSAPDIDPYIDRAARPGDTLLVEVIGLIAAIVASVVALRNIKGTRLVDQRANTLRENVGGRGAAGDKTVGSD